MIQFMHYLMLAQLLPTIIAKQEKKFKVKEYGFVWDSEKEPEAVVLDCENNLTYRPKRN